MAQTHRRIPREYVRTTDIAKLCVEGTRALGKGVRARIHAPSSRRDRKKSRAE